MTAITKDKNTEKGSFIVVLPPENQGRCIPVMWVSSQAREIPVTKTKAER